MPRSLLVLALAMTLAGCGVLGRPANAMRSLRDARTPDDVTRIRGRDPMVSDLWYLSAVQAPDQEQALALLERGETFHLHDPRVLVPQLSLLSQTGQPQLQEAKARADLTIGQSADTRTWLRWYLIDALLAQDDPDAAYEETLRLAGERRADPFQVSQALARVALKYEFLGRPDEADVAFEGSLGMGPAGVMQLLRDVELFPSQQAPARSMVSRAADANPEHADLHLYLVLDLVRADENLAAEAALDALPPHPQRLDGQVRMLRARLAILQGRVDEGLDLVRARLNEFRADPTAVMVLIECWENTGLPDAEEMRRRLTAAQPGLRFHPLLSDRIAATLEAVTAAEDAASPPPPAPPGEAGEAGPDDPDEDGSEEGSVDPAAGDR